MPGPKSSQPINRAQSSAVGCTLGREKILSRIVYSLVINSNAQRILCTNSALCLSRKRAI